MHIEVFEIVSHIVKNYILKTPKGFIIIDTGYPNGFKSFIKHFKKIGNLNDISYIFLTHAHDDHAGFLQELLQHVNNAKVILNPQGIPALESGKSSQPEGAGYSTKLASLFGVFKKDFSFPPVYLNDKAIFINNDKDQFFHSINLPLKIIMLPGHTNDSIGLFMEENRILFCGDAAMNLFPSTARHTIFMENKIDFQKSWDTMISLNPHKIYPTHGNPFNPKDLIKFKHFMDGKALIK